MAAKKSFVDAIFGKVSRKEAEDALKQEGLIEGSYLLRLREGEGVEYGLSVVHNKSISHYVITKHASRETPLGKYGIGDGLRYVTILETLEHYYKEPDGLSCCLKKNIVEIRSPPPLPETALPPSQRKMTDLEIPLSEICLGSELGHGEYGTVSAGEWKKKSGEVVRVAVKVLRDDTDVSMANACKSEAAVWINLQHVNVVLLLGVCSAAPMKLVCELVECGALSKFVRKERFSLDVRNLTKIICQIAQGMEYLESKAVVHRDLAARNILVQSKDLVKVSDFGLSRSLGASDYYTSARRGKWPIKWYAPECIYFSKFTHKSDVWSFGVTAWEVLTYGKKPYKGLTARQVLEVLKDRGRLDRPEIATDELSNLLTICMSEEPAARPSFTALTLYLVALCESDLALARKPAVLPTPGKPNPYEMVVMEKGVHNLALNLDSDDKGGNATYVNLLASQALFDIEPTPEEQEADDAEERSSNPVGTATATSPVELRPDSIVFKERIAEGSFGDVLTGVYTPPGAKTGIAVALKTIKAAPIFREAEILSKFNDVHLVKLYGVVTVRTGVYLVSEFLPLGSMNTYLKQNRDRVNLAAILRFSHQVVAGMRHIESERLVHRDLAARNVLVASDILCKVGDYGLARVLNLGSEYYRCQQKGKWPIKWYAPESLFENKFTSTSDIWSYGVTIWEFLTYGEKPYGTLSGREVIIFLEGGRRLEIPKSTPSWLGKLIADCWQRNPNDRPTFSKLLDAFVASENRAYS